MMIGLHPAPEELKAFFLSSPGQPAAPEVAEHLLSECSACRQEAALLLAEPGIAVHRAPAALSSGALTGTTDSVRWSDYPSEAGDPRYGRAFQAALRGAVRARDRLLAEQSTVSSLLARILGQPYRRQLLLIRNSHRYRSRLVCEGLLEASWKARFDDPQRCADLARVALELCRLLPRTAAEMESVNDLEARCWVELANGLRILTDFSGAEDAFRQAAKLLVAGSGNPSDVARYLDLRASLLSAQRRYDEAEQSVTSASAVYRELGELHLLGMALVKRGMIAGYAGDPERQIVLARQGLELVSAQLEPRMLIFGWHNVIVALHETGRDRDALAALGRARPLYLDLADRTTLLRFQWLEGMIARSLGRLEQAEGCLAEAREGFIRLGIAHDAALVSLELAAVLADQGRQAEVGRLAAEMIAIFESRESRRETLAALLLLGKAAERGRVTVRLVQRLLASASQASARS